MLIIVRRIVVQEKQGFTIRNGIYAQSIVLISASTIIPWSLTYGKVFRADGRKFSATVCLQAHKWRRRLNRAERLIEWSSWPVHLIYPLGREWAPDGALMGPARSASRPLKDEGHGYWVGDSLWAGSKHSSRCRGHTLACLSQPPSLKAWTVL